MGDAYLLVAWGGRGVTEPRGRMVGKRFIRAPGTPGAGRLGTVRDVMGVNG